MDKHDRFLAINQTLPGLEDFLKVVLGSEPLSEEANRQRIDFLRRLESVSRPPSLPPRPANLSEIYRARLQQNEAPSGSGINDESSVYKNDKAIDPVQFASQQRELSRFATLYKTYAPQTVIIGEKGNRNGGLYFARPGNTRDGIRDSIQSTSSTEDDLYEHLSLKGISPSDPVSTQDGDGSTKTEDSFVFPSPPKTPQEHSSSIYIPTRSGSLRASGGKGRLPTGWFKRETKLNEEVYVSHLREPVIKGYLKDIKANKRRWCVLQGNRLHIFKNQEDPAIMILYLPECNIGVDDKKKISYSFRLIPADGAGVTLAIEDGQDLSPWMSAIMAAAVRRSSIDRPISPLEGLFSLEQARAERMRSSELDGGIEEELEELEELEEDIYEQPMDHSGCGMPSAHSTPVTKESKDEDSEGYDAPLPPLPIDDDDSSSESSSDEDESMEKKVSDEKAAVKKKIYDQIPPDLLAELAAGQHKGGNETSKSQDSICDEGSTNDQSLDFTDSHSEHSGNISNRHSYIEPIASDDTVSSEPKEETIDNVSRKRTSTVLSISTESVCSDTEHPRTSSVTSDTSVTSKGLGPKVKRQRKLVPAEAELQFLQDPSAMHSGILYQKRRLGVWSKRYCKILDSRFKCYRNPADQKPSLNFPILGYDVSLIDNKESRKSYCIKISHPSQETYYFATDSRVSIERWIEVLSLAATGRLDVIAPYPPYFCAEQSGDELKSRSRESLLSSEGRLSDDDSADTLDELDPPAEKSQSLNRLQANEEILPTEKTYTVLPNESRNVEVSVQTEEKCQESGVEQSPETGKKERTQKKRKEKPREGTKTPSTMSPPHSMFISESVDGLAKPEPMNEEYASRPQGNAKESSEDSSPKKDKRWTDTLKKKKLSRGHSYDYRLRGNVTPFTQPDNAKHKHPSMRRKNSQTIANLTHLFDREGRFCGYLTEVRYNKFGTTHLRRWCVVKNGLLILFNSEREDTPQGKLSLVDMWLTDKSDESRNKFCFTLEDKDGNETTLQTTVEEDFQKWMGVLKLFTELRVERPQPEVAAEPLAKTDSCASDLGDGSFERGTLRTKSSRAAAKIKDEIYALAPGKVRTSLRMKLSQRRNVIDLFRKTHSSYDLEAGAPPEGSSLPEADVDTLAVFGGNLTQVESNGSTNSRWCTIKQKELMIFSDRKASDPLRKIPLLRSAFSDLSDDESGPNRFQIRFCNETLVFDACDKFDHNRWLRMLGSEIERRNSSDDDRPKCVGRLTSPTFAKKKILHRRARSEALSQEEETPTSATKTREGSTSPTDRLMSGYLQEVRETHGARTLLRRWCVATSENFIVYENQNSKKASFEWELSQMSVQDQSNIDAGTFGFCVFLGLEKLCFKVIDEDSARHWLSVLARYCHSVAANEPLRSNSKEDRRRSASDNDLKSKSTEKDPNVLEVLSEGRASGRKLMRRATEDSTFFRKFNRSELFKAPWRASTEKLEVKMRDRERSGRAAANKALKRFSCGSLFDSDGKYSGHLMELITHELYSSQVRRWCVQKDDYLYIYENEAADEPIKVVPLSNAKVVDTSDVESCIYRFRVDYGEGEAVFFRALTRTDLEKWTTVISVKTAVLLGRSERQLRRSRTLSSEKSSSESEVTSPDHRATRTLTADSGSYNETVSIWSADSVFDPTNDPGSAGLKPINPDEESVTSPVERRDEQPPNDQHDDPPSAGRTVAEAEISDNNRKTVSSLSSVEDLSHVYENFLAFASAMAERSPEFKEQLYHVYENVTQALDRGDVESTQNEGQITEELPEEAGQGNNEADELGSPSMEMSSEFEKISLRENEEKCTLHVYRYSGVHGESDLEKVVGNANENEHHVMDATAEEDKGKQTEGNQEHVMARGGCAYETECAAVDSVSRVAEELVEVNSGDEDPVANEDAVNESEQETGSSRIDNEVQEIRDSESDTGCVSVEDSINTSDGLYELQSQTGEIVNEATASQSSVQDKSVREDSSSRPLVHVDHVNAVETGESSLYLVEQVNDQVRREVEDEECSGLVVEPSDVLEDAVRVSTSCDNISKSFLERDCFASAVEKSASNEVDERRTSNLRVEDSNNALECTRNDFNVENEDESLNKPEVSETEPPCFNPAEDEDDQKELQDGECCATEGDKTWNIADKTLEASENVCAAEAFESSSPAMLKCSKEAEVPCEQTLASEVYVSEHAQIWEEAVTRIDEIPSSTMQDYELESHVLLESPNSDLESGDFTSAQGSPEVEPYEMCNDSNQGDTAHDNVDQSLSSGLSSQTNLEGSSPETGINLANTVETNSETVSNFPEERYAKTNQLEQESSTAFAFSNEHGENFQATDVCSNNSLSNEPLEDNSALQQDYEEPEGAVDEGIELEKRCSSSEGYYTPEDTIELLVRRDSIAEEQTETDCASDRHQNSNPELGCINDETKPADPESVLQSEKEDVATPCFQLNDHELDRGVETDSTNSQNQPPSVWSNDDSSLGVTQDLTRSQMDILKAVTAAFEEILELHGDDSDTDDTRL